MSDTPTPRCDALEDQLRHDPEASRDFELVCFSDLARDLERQLAEATAWRQIDSAPKDGRQVWLWQADVAKHWADDSFPYTPRAALWDTDNGWTDGDGCRVKGATHWQPLPNPPTV